MKYILNTDGGSRGNPGPAGAGAVLANDKGKTLKEASKALGVMPNNEAEYHGLLLGLDLAKKTLGKEKIKDLAIEVKMDSELVVSQLNGKYQIKEERLQKLFMKIWNMRVKTFKKIKFTHIPRTKNKRADELANIAMDEGGKETLFN
ncbi:MAG: ribonuclease HI family protein [bacterium]|nr:ribonuclease HI family protein [bacterium]